jgi:hypothetical protein
MDKQNKEWLTVAEAAKALDGCAATVRSYCRSGKLMYKKSGVGGRTSRWLVSRASIDLYRKANRNS